MAIVHGYCLEQELRDQFSDGASNLPSALLIRAINATSRAIDDWCGRRFWQDPAVVTRQYVPDTCRLAFVDDFADTANLVVKVDSSLNGSFATTWTLNSEFAIRPSNADKDGEPWYKIVTLDGREFPMSCNRETLQVANKFGYGAIYPDSVNQACILRSAAIFKRREAIDGVRGFGEFGPVRISRYADPDVVDLLKGVVREDKRAS